MKKPFTGRTYDVNNKKYPSVTSIIHPDGIDFPEFLLKQYASRGSAVHAVVESYLLTGKMPVYEDVIDKKDLHILRNGSRRLDVWDCKIQGFFIKHGKRLIPTMLEEKLINHEHGYAGRADIIGLFDNVLSMMDIKTSSNYDEKKLTDYWMQQAAYIHCLNLKPKQMVILPINPKDERGYGDPIVCDEVDKYFSLFLEKLKYFNDNYEIK